MWKNRYIMTQVISYVTSYTTSVSVSIPQKNFGISWLSYDSKFLIFWQQTIDVEIDKV